MTSRSPASPALPRARYPIYPFDLRTQEYVIPPMMVSTTIIAIVIAEIAPPPNPSSDEAISGARCESRLRSNGRWRRCRRLGG